MYPFYSNHKRVLPSNETLDKIKHKQLILYATDSFEYPLLFVYQHLILSCSLFPTQVDKVHARKKKMIGCIGQEGPFFFINQDHSSILFTLTTKESVMIAHRSQPQRPLVYFPSLDDRMTSFDDLSSVRPPGLSSQPHPDEIWPGDGLTGLSKGRRSSDSVETTHV